MQGNTPEPGSAAADCAQHISPHAAAYAERFPLVLQASTGYGALYIVMLAVDVVTSLLHSLSGIVDRCAVPPAQSNGAGAAPQAPFLPVPAAGLPAEPNLPGRKATTAPRPLQPPGSPAALLVPAGQSPLAVHSSTLVPPDTSAAISLHVPAPPAAETAGGGAGDVAGATPGGSGDSGSLWPQVAAAASSGAELPQDARLPSMYASQLAMEKLWPLLPAPTPETCRMLAGILWQPALEVRPRPPVVRTTAWIVLGESYARSWA